MSVTTKREAMRERIRRHGENLLVIFPKATERDPVALCKKLRRLEAQASKHALELCNCDDPGEHGDAWHKKHDDALFLVLNKANVLLGNTIDKPPTVPVFINRDPRGYALKIDDEYVRANGLKIHAGA